MAHLDASPEAVESRSSEMAEDAAAATEEFLAGDEELDEPDSGVEPDEPEEEGDEPDDEGDDEEEEGDELETAIDAPASLTAEEKEQFAQLPPEAQQYVKSFAVRRDKEIQSGLEQARSAQRDAMAEAAEKSAAARKQAAESIYSLANAYAPQAPDPRQYSDQHQYNADKYTYDQQLAQHEQIVQHAVNEYEQATTEQQQVDQHFIAQRDKGLLEIPEVANAETRDAFFAKAFETAEELGWDRDFLVQNGDAKDFKAIGRVTEWKAKAVKWDALQSKRMQGVRAGKVAKSNAVQPRGSGKVSRAEKNFERNPSRESAAELLKGYI